jgi:hypothetical protein
MSISSQTIDDCALCLRRDILRLSHIIPRGCYRRVSMGERIAVNIVKDQAVLIQSQLKTPLLCKDCEDKFNKNGERYFLLQCLQPDHSFPLLDRAYFARHALNRISPTTAYWKAADLGIDHFKIAYFAASLFWRTFVAKEKLPDERISLDIGPVAAEALRKFLNLEAQDMPGVTIKVDVIEGIPGIPHDFRYNFALPQEIPNNLGVGVRFYTAEALGFAFSMISASDPDMLAAIYTNCFLHNNDHPLFVSQDMQKATVSRQEAWVRRSTPDKNLRAFQKSQDAVS